MEEVLRQVLRKGVKEKVRQGVKETTLRINSGKGVEINIFRKQKGVFLLNVLCRAMSPLSTCV